MTPKQQVPVLETSKLLKEKGWKTETYFIWRQIGFYEDSFDKRESWIVVDGSHAGWNFLFAPTVEELLEEFRTMILKDGEINEEIADRVDNLVLHCWTEPNLAQLLAELWLETRKEVQP